MKGRIWKIFTSLLLVVSTVMPSNITFVAAQERDPVIVDDNVIDSTQKHYFTYSEATDPTGMTGWSEDPASIGSGELKTQHWTWNNDNEEAAKHVYTFTFEGTGVDIVGIGATGSPTNVFQLDNRDPEIMNISTTKEETTFYSVRDLNFGTHTVSVSIPNDGNHRGLQVSYAKVYGAETNSEEENLVKTEIPFTKTEGSTNKFTYSQTGWDAMGNSSEHVWSNAPADENIWYEVSFVGKKIEVYAGKNRPMGFVEYFIDGKPYGTYDLYNNGNINSTLIATLTADTDGQHTFKAVATGEKRAEATNNGIDCANVIVYHAPYQIDSVALSETNKTLIAGTTYQIELIQEPDYADLGEVTYTSKNPDVATVNEKGVVEAVSAGKTTIEVHVPDTNETLTMEVTVEEAKPQIHGSIVSTDLHYTQEDYDEIKEMGVMSETLTAWSNDKALSEIAVISKDSKLDEVTVSASDFSDGTNIIGKENVQATFIKSTLAYNGPYLGYGSKDRPIPENNGTNRSESPDILYSSDPVNIAYNKVQSIWVEISVPSNTPAGTYTGTIGVTAKDIEEPLQFTYTLNVQGVELPSADTYANTFDIELWQYPYSIAEYYGVEAFSEEHLELMKSSMQIYKDMGGHAITTTIIEDAWGGQTYSANDIHYPSMVKWIKNEDGSFTYDYHDFDTWVQFNKDLGIGDKIVLYSIAPWHNSFTYWENGTLVTKAFDFNNEADRNMWTDFLNDLIDHLMEKGWFDESYIGIDERGFSKTAFDFIDSVRNIYDQPLKTAGAMDGFVDKWDLALRVTDLNVGDTAAAAHPEKFQELVAAREALGYRTTLYSCTEHRPGNFALSAPVESYWSIVNAGASGTAGFLRWAYDAWVEDPLRDITHNAFEAGDTALIYPDEKDAETPTAKPSVRLEKMAEGVRDVNKVMMMLNEIPSLQADVDALYANVKYQANIGRTYLSDHEVTQIKQEMDAFKKGLADLTEKYILLKESGTDQVDSVSIVEKDQELMLGNSLQLHAEVAPANVLNDKVNWTSSNSKVASVTSAGVVSANQTGKAVITATSEQDTTKSASITITVTDAVIEESAQVAYYSFDDLDDSGIVVDSWGSRNGTSAGTFAEGKSGKALQVTEAGKGVTLSGTSGIADDDAWSIGYWVNTTSKFNQQISVISSADGSYAASLKMAADRDSGFRVGKGNGDVLTFAYGFQPNNWYHITWTQSKTDGLSMYVNGTLVSNNAWTKNHNISIPLDVIGAAGFTGLIDEVKVYNRVLNQSEIRSIMQVKGLNLAESYKKINIGDTYTIQTNLYSDQEDKTITYTSNHPEVASVDSSGIVTGNKRGSAIITVENKAGGYKEEVTIDVEKELTIKNTLDVYQLPEENLSDIEKSPNTDRQYLGQPDMVKTSTGRLITAYPKGHGKGPLIMQISDDNGETWTEKTDLPASWEGSQETPTMYVLNLADGTERIMLITACPGWGTDSAGHSTGWNTSYSDDNGETWTEYAHWYDNHPDGTSNKAIVGMASLIQLKDENGNDMQKWMGVYHDYNYINYKTYLTFDENGQEQWSAPEAYLSDYRDIESSYQMCEIGMFRSPDGNRIIGLARSQSHNHPATLIYSDDEGETWSKPMDLPGSLAGERHKAAYDPITGRLVITFREIIYDLNDNNQFDGNSDWLAGDWVAWVGTYEDLMEQNDGEYRILLAEDYAPSAKSGDTGYTGMVVLDDGTFIMDSYGHWDEDFSNAWNGGVTTDLCYIKQAKFKLAEIDNLAGKIDRDSLQTTIEEADEITDQSLYTVSSWDEFQTALANAKTILADKGSAQKQIDDAETALLTSIEQLVKMVSVTLTTNNENAGFITGAGTYEPGTTVTLKAEAADGYDFVGWLEGDVILSKDAEYRFTISNSQTITAVFVPKGTEVDRSALYTAIMEAEKITDETLYTDESWEDFQTALAKAKDIFADENATQIDLDTALTNLNDAILGLIKKPELEPDIPATPGINGESNDGGSETANTGTTTTPGTGDTTNANGWILLMLAGAGMMIAFRKMKKSSEK